MTTTTKVKIEATEVAVNYGEKVVERKRNLEGYTWGVLRLGMGWIFFWAFIDKLFGLGFATASGDAWLAGGSPTFGFLNFGAKGPFVEFYNAIAGNVFVDWMFMIGLLAVGLPLLLGIGVKLAGYTGTLMGAMTEFDSEIGLDRLMVVHANDAKVEFASGVDRHENIGEGHIGIKGFEVIMGHPAFRDVPFLLEVPGADKKGPDKENLDRLKEIRQRLKVPA